MYHVTSLPSPLHAYTHAHAQGGGRFDIRVGQKQTTAKGMEDLELIIPFSKDVTGVNCTTSREPAWAVQCGRVLVGALQFDSTLSVSPTQLVLHGMTQQRGS